MYPLVESIKVLDGHPHNLEWHQRRYEKSYRKYYGKNPKYRISQVFSVPDEYSSGLVKGRFCYNEDDFYWEFHHYTPHKCNTLKIIHDNQIEYNLKLTDRSALKHLYSQRGNCDDILIVKQGYITDTFASNIVFFDGKRWITPANPLLEGTTRARLIHSGKIHEADIMLNDLAGFEKFQLINAMIGFDEKAGKPISAIYF